MRGNGTISDLVAETNMIARGGFEFVMLLSFLFYWI